MCYTLCALSFCAPFRGVFFAASIDQTGRKKRKELKAGRKEKRKKEERKKRKKEKEKKKKEERRPEAGQ